MASSVFKSRLDLDAMVDEIERQLEQLYRAASQASRAEVWAGLTHATLKLAAPEDRDYVYQRLHRIFSAHGRAQTPAP